jgi:hypothetical protein
MKRKWKIKKKIKPHISVISGLFERAKFLPSDKKQPRTPNNSGMLIPDV